MPESHPRAAARMRSDMTQGLDVVDAHMHLWDLQRIRYPWLTPPLPVGITGDVSPIARDYLLDNY